LIFLSVNTRQRAWIARFRREAEFFHNERRQDALQKVMNSHRLDALKGAVVSLKQQLKLSEESECLELLQHLGELVKEIHNCALKLQENSLKDGKA